MWDIYNTLSKYQLDDLYKLSLNLPELSNRQLVAFMEDILGLTSLDTIEIINAPEEVNLCPIGGDLSLGNLQEISKQVLLYADHVVLEESLSFIAKHTIETTGGDLNKQSSFREELVQRLHLLIRQLILIRPAIEQGIVVLVHPSVPVSERALKLSDKIVHPKLERIRHKLCEKVICYQQPNGRLFFQFGKGSNRFVGRAGSLFKPYELLQHLRLPLTEREISIPDHPDWTPPIGSKKVSGRLIESDTKSINLFDIAVNYIIGRVVLGIHIAQLNESNYMTDDPIEWEILKLLSRIEGEQNRVDISEHVYNAFSMRIAHELAFLENVQLGTILQVRQNYDDEFLAFRSSLKSLCEKIRDIDITDWDSLNSVAKQTVRREIYPAISDIKSVFRNLGMQRQLDTAIKFGIAGLSLASYVVSPESQIQPWIGSPLIPQLEVRKIQRNVKADQLRSRPMYFLWEVMRRAKSST